MKKVYVKPIVEGVVTSLADGIMIGGSGEIDPGNAMTKKHDLVDDDDEFDDDFETETASVEPQSFFSNDYIKEVWE